MNIFWGTRNRLCPITTKIYGPREVTESGDKSSFAEDGKDSGSFPKSQISRSVRPRIVAWEIGGHLSGE